MGAAASSKKLFTEFEVKKLLGRGAFGAVIKVENKFDENAYAVKLVLLHKENRDLALKEVKCFAKVLSHENVVPYKTSWIDEITKAELDGLRKTLQLDIATSDILKFNLNTSRIEILCIQMELCDESLRSWNRKRVTKVAKIDELFAPYGDLLSKVNEDENISVLYQVTYGLAHIHDHNIIHRDLKPDNIFITNRPNNKLTVKIGDLGLGKQIRQLQGPATHSITGTELYIPPEQRAGRYDHRVDIFPLGIILLELFYPTPLDQDFQLLVLSMTTAQEIPEIVSTRWPMIAAWILQLSSPRMEQRPTLLEIQKSLRSIKQVFQKGFCHWGITCDGEGCKVKAEGEKSIRGLRYKCQDCTQKGGFDFCEECFEKEQDKHEQGHTFKKMNHKDTKEAHHKTIWEKINEALSEINSDDVKLSRKCGRCQDEISNDSKFFKCTQCDDIYYCTTCKTNSKMHTLLHKFKAIEIKDGVEVATESPPQSDGPEELLRKLLALAIGLEAARE